MRLEKKDARVKYRYPECAWCGNALLQRFGDREIVRFRGAGSPCVGWHFSCAEIDPLYKLRRKPERQTHLLNEIISRGAPRVSAGSHFWKAFATKEAV